MDARAWKIRDYRLDDVDALRDLFAVVFHQVRPREHFVWKYHDNPVGRAVITVAEASSGIVGVYALVPTRIRLGDRLVLGAQSLDTMTHTDFRGQGMFVALARACMETASANGVEILYGFPNDASYHGFVNRLGWKHADDIPRWVRLLNPDSVAAMPRPIQHLASIGLRILWTGNSAPKGIDVRTNRPSVDELLALAGSDVPDSRCRVERSRDWYSWRFDSASQRKYLWFSAYREGRLRAWAAFGINEWGEVPLLDMAGIEAEALEAVVSSATRHAKALGLGVLESFTNDQVAERALRSCGYFRRGSLPLIVRSLPSRDPRSKISLPTSWYISSEDADTF